MYGSELLQILSIHISVTLIWLAGFRAASKTGYSRLFYNVWTISKDIVSEDNEGNKNYLDKCFYEIYSRVT